MNAAHAYEYLVTLRAARQDPGRHRALRFRIASSSVAFLTGLATCASHPASIAFFSASAPYRAVLPCSRRSGARGVERRASQGVVGFFGRCQ